jgi:hypothetical protein
MVTVEGRWLRELEMFFQNATGGVRVLQPYTDLQNDDLKG